MVRTCTPCWIRLIAFEENTVSIGCLIPSAVDRTVHQQPILWFEMVFRADHSLESFYSASMTNTLAYDSQRDDRGRPRHCLLSLCHINMHRDGGSGFLILSCLVLLSERHRETCHGTKGLFGGNCSHWAEFLPRENEFGSQKHHDCVHWHWLLHDQISSVVS